MSCIKNAPTADQDVTRNHSPAGEIISNGEIFVGSRAILLQSSASVVSANYIGASGYPSISTNDPLLASIGVTTTIGYNTGSQGQSYRSGASGFRFHLMRFFGNIRSTGF